MRIDPTGMNDHDYKLNSNGTFTKLQDTTTPDRVFNDKGDFVELETNGQIEKMKSVGGISFSKFSDKTKSKEAFEFFASNSNIEWGLLNTRNSSYVFNSGDDVSINGSGFAYSFFLSQNIEVTDLYHSHPVHAFGQETPSGYGHNPTKNNMYSEPNPYREEGDYQSLRLLIYGGEVNGVPVKAMGDKARNINFRVFNTVDKSYIQYDENKAIKLPK